MKNSLLLLSPGKTAKQLVIFLRQTYAHAQKKYAIIAVSGGIDSALALTLATEALGAAKIMPVLLPYGAQDMNDAEAMLEFNHIPRENWQIINIQNWVGAIAEGAGLKREDAYGEAWGESERVRLGNLMARVRMMLVYDLAKDVHGLVCGTENKSEKYLGYFTRFGDEASDVEPLIGLYKTQVWQLGEFLGLPEQVLSKAPSAGLWNGQSDEVELGFSYEVADRVLVQLVDEGRKAGEIKVEGIEDEVVQLVLARVKQMEFKQQVPYVMKS